ncbi:arylsulfatase [Limnohabitans sp. 103DPR2]|uniref:arylsulfatase n=1 Tax=Limnohabitans sp. 103DPR2 TaxID=1678129 RepID=UPI000705FB33|nr:arylsulfatase [Limnohabitans sp. 103DPR2]ALK92902.1 Arylsulfatase [Limnohabitans sp. 103DPR2]
MSLICSTRHTWLSIFAAATLAICAPAWAKRPNIVVLLADDWGYSDVGAFGSEINTPHLNQLAQSGTRFSNFHVSASCSPTRSMLLTGVDNHLNGVGNMRETIPQSHVGRAGYLSVLNQRVVTVASLLQDQGYRTYAAGKWHVGKEPHNLPPARGFDRSLVMGDSGSDNWETGKLYLDLTDKVYWYDNGREAQMPKTFYSSEFYVSKTLDYLKTDAKSDKPFFAYLAFQANHIPLQAPQEFIDKYKGRYNAGWDVLRQERRNKAIELGLVPPNTPMAALPATHVAWDSLSPQDKAYQARRMEVYAAMAEAMDFHIGRLMAHLKQTGEYDNTVFVFMSDNGAEASDPYALAVGRWWLDQHYNRDIDRLGSPGAYSIIGPNWARAATAPLNTYKFFAGEGGIRVPLIISGIPAAHKQSVQNSLTHVSDIVPTLLDLAGVQHPGTSYKGQTIYPLTGHSLLPILQGKATRVRGPEEVLGYELSGNRAVFKGDYKLLSNLAPVGDGQWHLYNIATDPGETRDLKDEMPELFQSLQNDYAKWAKANGVLPMPEGYDPIQQVIINSLVFVYWPRYQWHLAGLGVLLLLSGVWLWRRRR